jgi:hypothetical protein
VQVLEPWTALRNLHRKTIYFAAVRRGGAESYLEHAFAPEAARSVHQRSKPKVFAKELCYMALHVLRKRNNEFKK